MTVRFPSPFRGWRAAFLLVAAACASPGRASAECGDHVIILNGPAAANGKAAPANPSPDAQPAAPRRPCHGPNCSGSPTKTPVAPVTAPTTQFKEQAGQAAGGCDADRDPGSPFDRDSASPRPISRPSSVFHPPRLG